jgi:hypothetical protein
MNGFLAVFGGLAPAVQAIGACRFLKLRARVFNSPKNFQSAKPIEIKNGTYPLCSHAKRVGGVYR